MMRVTNGTIATSIQEICSALVGGGAGAPMAPTGADALATVCRGLFGGAARQRARSRKATLDETVEIIVPRQSILTLA